MLASERSRSRWARISARAVAGVETESLAELYPLLQREALRLGLVAHTAQMRGLVRQDRDREGGVVARADAGPRT